MQRDDGFTLIEVVCVLAIVGLIAAIVLPAFPRTTSRNKLESYAVAVAAILRADRNVALREHRTVATTIDAQARQLQSGSAPARIGLPADVEVKAMLPVRCAGREVGMTIDFLPSGLSCGGAVALRRGTASYEVRVNWLTGDVEVLPQP